MKACTSAVVSAMSACSLCHISLTQSHPPPVCLFSGSCLTGVSQARSCFRWPSPEPTGSCRASALSPRATGEAGTKIRCVILHMSEPLPARQSAHTHTYTRTHHSHPRAGGASPTNVEQLLSDIKITTYTQTQQQHWTYSDTEPNKRSALQLKNPQDSTENDVTELICLPLTERITQGGTVVVVVGRVRTVKSTSMCVRSDSNHLFRKQKNSKNVLGWGFAVPGEMIKLLFKRKDDDENLNHLFVFSNMLIVFPEFCKAYYFDWKVSTHGACLILVVLNRSDNDLQMSRKILLWHVIGFW